MNMNQIVNIIIRLFMRRAINTGINSGIKAMTGKGRKQPRNIVDGTRQTAVLDDDDLELTDAEVREVIRARRQRKANRLARQAAKAERRTSEG